MSIESKPFALHFLGYIFTPRLVPALLTLVLCPILVSLGLWQLDRADEKRVIDRGVNDAIAKPALDFNIADFANLKDEIYRTATVTGAYDTKNQFLLDNRTHKGLPGYHVLSPYLLSDEAGNLTKNAILINRGWIAYKGTRDQIPDISLDHENSKILGSIKNIPRSIVLKDQVAGNTPNTMIFKKEEKQLVGVSLIQSIQMNSLEKELNYKLLPVIIELDETQNNGFVREWQPYFGSIDKHKAYAIQWFAMASILLFLFLKLNIRKR